MQTTSNGFKTAIIASKRNMKAKAELYNGSALAATYTQDDRIKSITIERVGEASKFFGFGVSHKMNLKLIDVKRELDISTANNFVLKIGIETTEGTLYSDFPRMYVSEVHRDEKTNELSITAYDILNDFKNYNVSMINISGPYTIAQFIAAVGAHLNVSVSVPEDIEAFSLSYEESANFDGSETLYDALTDAAEATQTIFFINASGILTFKRLDKNGPVVLSITKNEWITLDSGANRRLQTIANITELGDNVEASTSQLGTTQYIRDNAFLDLREDIADILNAAVAEIGDMTINQFECTWRGNPALEIGDKIALVTKDNQNVVSYVLNDSISYNGALEQKTEWSYTETTETASNSVNLGEVLKQTYAKVDKANKQVEILTSETSSYSEAIAALQMNTDSINISVQKMEENTAEVLEGMNADIMKLTSKVETAMTAEAVTIAIRNELANGVDKVVTSTGFTFNEEGLIVSKTGTEMTTKITEDGMSIQKDGAEMLTANNEGVTAYDLHAKTYLIIGESSRFEDYDKDGETRTGCFWIGG